MSTVKKKQAVAVAPTPLPWRAFLAEYRVALTFLSLVTAFGVAAGFVWQNVRAHVLADSSYRLEIDNLESTPQPPWIRSDVKTSVFRDADLANCSLLDEGLSQRVHQAFSLHPWIERVLQVRKRYPAAISVDLVYRKPAAMVEVAGGLLPIDGSGVLLPSDDFSPADASHYPRVAGVESQPRGLVGTAWGDPLVVDAGRITGLLASNWEAWHFQKLNCPLPKSPENPRPLGFRLRHESGATVLWESAPDREAGSESKAAEKLARLQTFFRDHPTPREADFRDLDLVNREVKAGGN